MKSQHIAPKPKHPKGPWDTVIIGSGPSGLTAAIYTTRGAASTLILGGEVWGGQLMLTTNVDNFPGFSDGVMGPTLMENMRKQAERFGAEFIQANVKSIDPAKTPFEITVDGKTYLAKTIVIATGAQTKWLDAPGIKELIGKGISSCAPCDAPFFKDKKVAVVGGGDSAMEEALVLTKYASEVTLIHRRNEFKASIAMQNKVKENPKIKLIMNTEVVEAKGTDKLEKLVLKDVETNKTIDFAVDGLFVAIGHAPSTDIFKGQIDLDERGFITNNGTKTNIPGIFVSGDVHDHEYKQAITASGFGCMAGMDVLKYLSEDK